MKTQHFIATLSPWQFSSLLHFAVLTLFAVFLIEPKKATIIDFSVVDAPVAVSESKIIPEKMKPKEEKINKQAVFGVSRKALTTDSSEGETVKLGNTVAVAPDDKRLKDTDPDALPLPADEFTVTQMPTLRSEVRIPYPEEAKRKSIQGAVVMDVLVDAAGRVRQVKVLDGPGFGLNEAAEQSMMRFVFSPAKVGDQPVAVRIRYSYRFVLEK